MREQSRSVSVPGCWPHGECSESLFVEKHPAVGTGTDTIAASAVPGIFLDFAAVLAPAGAGCSPASPRDESSRTESGLQGWPIGPYKKKLSSKFRK
jgi:hypothetical protein